TSAAPSVGPRAPATAPVAPHTARANGSLAWGVPRRTSAIEEGRRIAAPRPCTSRARTSTAGFGAIAQASDATVKSVDPARNVALWPRRSAARPAGTSSAAKMIVYPLRIHDSSAGATSGNDSVIDGNATNSTEVSRNTANTARLLMKSVAHGTCGSLVVSAVGRSGAGRVDGRLIVQSLNESRATSSDGRVTISGRFGSSRRAEHRGPRPVLRVGRLGRPVCAGPRWCGRHD